VLSAIRLRGDSWYGMRRHRGERGVFIPRAKILEHCGFGKSYHLEDIVRATGIRKADVEAALKGLEYCRRKRRNRHVDYTFDPLPTEDEAERERLDGLAAYPEMVATHRKVPSIAALRHVSGAGSATAAAITMATVVVPTRSAFRTVA
jgi:hypothetical protein